MAITNGLRFRILKRDGFKCVYCGRGASEVDVEIDHAQSRHDGGSDDFENLVTACYDCNRGKSSDSAVPPDLAAHKPAHKNGSLIGKCFLTFKDGKVHFQGIVREKLSDTEYMIQYFSWLTGDPTTMNMVNTTQMFGDDPISGDGWKWFANSQDLCGWIDSNPQFGN